MERKNLPELSAQFKKVLWKRFPKNKKYLLGRNWARQGNFISGGSMVREYCRALTGHDKVLLNFDSRAPGDISREHGIDTMGFESDRIFQRLWRNRHRGDELLKDVLFEEYVAFRNRWMRDYGARYAPKALKRVSA